MYGEHGYLLPVGFAGSTKSRGRYAFRPVMCLTTGITYSSVSEASACTGVSKSSIVNCCRGRATTAGRMKWSYITHLPKPVRVRVKSRNGGFSEHIIYGVKCDKDLCSALPHFASIQ